MSAKINYRLFALLWLPVFLTAFTSPTKSYATDLTNNPFWIASVGYWVSDNTYLDGSYNSKIPYYQTLKAISIKGNLVTSEERKFYPPGAFAGSALGLDIPAEQGVELIQISRGEAGDDVTVVNFAPLNVYSQNQNIRLKTVSADTATMTVTDKETGVLAYQMLITVPTAHSRITASLGINGSFANQPDETPLRGVSIFSATRIDEQTYHQQTKMLQQQFQVGTIVTIDQHGQFVASPLH